MEYPDFKETTGYGKVDGYAGVNCRHHAMPFDPETMKNNMPQYDEAEAQKQYEAESKQRRKERGIRNSKRQIQALKTVRDNAKDETTAKIAEEKLEKVSAKLARQNKEYRTFCKEHGLKIMNERLKIGR